jgi:hypothetical protein
MLKHDQLSFLGVNSQSYYFQRSLGESEYSGTPLIWIDWDDE